MLASHGATLAHFISKEHVLHCDDFVPRNKSTIWYLNHKFTHSASNSRSPTSVGGWIADSARQLNASNANRHPNADLMDIAQPRKCSPQRLTTLDRV